MSSLYLWLKTIHVLAVIVWVGAAITVFARGGAPATLQLIASKTTPLGVAIAAYEPGAPPSPPTA